MTNEIATSELMQVGSETEQELTLGMDISRLTDSFVEANTQPEETSATEEKEETKEDPKKEEEQKETSEEKENEEEKEETEEVDFKAKYEELAKEKEALSKRVNDLETLKGKFANEIGKMRSLEKELQEVKKSTEAKIPMPEDLKKAYIKAVEDGDPVKALEIMQEYSSQIVQKELKAERQKLEESQKFNEFKSEMTEAIKEVEKETKELKLDGKNITDKMIEIAKRNPQMYLVKTEEGTMFSGGDAIRECFKIAKKELDFDSHVSLMKEVVNKNKELEKEIKELRKLRKSKESLPISEGKKSEVKTEVENKPKNFYELQNEFLERNKGG